MSYETDLANVFIDVVDLPQGTTSGTLARSVQLTQSRLCLFVADADTGQPLVGLPVFVDAECDIRYRAPGPVSGDLVAQELPEEMFRARIPLGLLATDHLGYLSYDIARLPDLVATTDTRWKSITGDDIKQYQQSLQGLPLQISLRSIWIHPYGDFSFNGLRPGLFSIRPDAIVINALLRNNALTGETSRAGIPSMQEPSIVDWRLSPGSFAISPLLMVGDDECARFTPANVALETYYFQQVVLDAPPSRTVPSPAPSSTPGAPAVPPAGTPPSAQPGASPAASVPAGPGLISQPGALAAGQSPAGPSSVLTGDIAGESHAAAAGGAASPAIGASPDIVPAVRPAPLPAAAAVSPISPLTLQHGTLYVYRTQWFQLGHSLGKVLYSLALAPGENTDIAIIDWSREDQAARTEATAVTEQLIADLRRDRLIGETIDGVVNEKQEGGSTMAGGSLVGGAAATSGAMGGMLGLALSIGGGSAWTTGHRDLHLSTVQTLADRITQASAAVRELRSTVVVASHQREQNALVTRNISNYNHSHTLTVLYYELLRHLRLVTEFDRSFDIVLVHFPELQISRDDPTSLFQYLPFLRGRLLDPTLAPALDAYEALEIENGRPDPQSLPTPDEDLLVDGVIGSIVVHTRHTTDAAKNAVGLGVVAAAGDVAIQGSSPVPVTTFNTALVEVPLFFPAPWFGDELFDSSHVDDTYSHSNNVDVSILFASPTRWGDLRRLKIQCIFQDSDQGRAFRLTFKTVTGLSERGPIDLSFPQDDLDFQNMPDGGRKVSVPNAGDARITGSLMYVLRTPQPPPQPRSPFDRLSPDQQRLVLRLLNHVVDNMQTYSTAYWADHDIERIALLHALGTSFDASYWPVSSIGGMLAFPRLVPNPKLPEEMVLDERLITLPTRGVFADAKLGSCNVSEKIDPTRFWDWQISPIPFRAPDITGVQPKSQYQAPVGIQPTALPNPIVSIQTAPAAPDPSTAAALQALTAPNIFRDMSIAKEVAGVISDVTKAATQVAIAAGNMVKGGAGQGSSAGTGAGSSGGSGTGAPKPSSTSTTGPTGGGMTGMDGTTTGTTTGTTGTGTAVPASKSAQPPASTSNAKSLQVYVYLPSDYSAPGLGVVGLSDVLVGSEPSNRFWVSYAADSTGEVVAIELQAYIVDTASHQSVGNQLVGHYETTTAQPLSKLKILTCTPPTADVTVTAKTDIQNGIDIQDENKWSWNVSGGGKIDFPSVAAKLEGIADVQAMKESVELGGQYGQSGGTTATTSNKVIFGKGWTRTFKMVDFSSGLMDVKSTY